MPVPVQYMGAAYPGLVSDRIQVKRDSLVGVNEQDRMPGRGIVDVAQYAEDDAYWVTGSHTRDDSAALNWLSPHQVAS